MEDLELLADFVADGFFGLASVEYRSL